MAETFMLHCRKCGRLVCDVSDKDMLPNVLECQHCHHNNIIRRTNEESPEAPPASEPGEDTGEPLAGESEPGEDTGTGDQPEEEN